MTLKKPAAQKCAEFPRSPDYTRAFRKEAGLIDGARRHMLGTWDGRRPVTTSLWAISSCTVGSAALA